MRRYNLSDKYQTKIMFKNWRKYFNFCMDTHIRIRYDAQLKWRINSLKELSWMTIVVWWEPPALDVILKQFSLLYSSSTIDCLTVLTHSYWIRKLRMNLHFHSFWVKEPCLKDNLNQMLKEFYSQSFLIDLFVLSHENIYLWKHFFYI